MHYREDIMDSENILPEHLVTDEVASFSRWTGLEPEGLPDIMRHFQDHSSPHNAAAAECLHRIVEAIRAYCVERGVTKYCHWFNSWTESPAYKRDNIDHLSTKTLFQGEPDASSKPTGGLRSTYEARGYTVWDSKSPLFILNGTTLCIPTVFISYKGEALDLKSPALRASAALKKSVRRLFEAIEPGQIDWSKVKVRTFAGPEQEYFLIPKALADRRPDLIHCKSTVMGTTPPRNQQLEEHYLGSIPPDVHDFFERFNRELAKLGIVPSADHNEVAPRQFEFAPMFEEAVRAADQNLLAMHIMREVAAQHGWLAITHEKPFAGLNGSGKHLNFSVGLVNRATGKLLRNLHAPPDDPRQRLTFLVTLVATVAGIRRRARLLRASVATRSNDQRLGGNEAPPAIISVYLGEMLRQVSDQLVEQKERLSEPNGLTAINLGLSGVPLVSRDNTDRNRTSPLAFTGNKFEFRMPGANSAIYLPLTILQAAMAEAFDEVATKVEQRRSNGDSDLPKILSDVFAELLEEARPLIFDGDCYSAEWRAEAARRGLPEARDTASALFAFADPEQQEFLAKFGIWTQQESSAFFRAKMDEYAKIIAIEAATLLEMVSTGIMPAAHRHQTDLAERVAALSDAREIADERRHEAARGLVEQLDAAVASLADFGALVSRLEQGHAAVRRARAAMLAIAGDPAARGRFAAETVVPAIQALGVTCNELEALIPAELYPYPTYGQLLYGERLAIPRVIAPED